MTNRMNHLKQSIGAIVLCISIFSCSDDLGGLNNQDDQLTSTEVKSVLDASTLSNLTDGLLTDIFSGNQSGKMGKKPECQETVTSNDTTTITFTNCIVDGSEPINGIVSATYNIGDETTLINVTYTDFSVGEIAISGTKTFTVDASGQEEGFMFTVESDLQITFADGKLFAENGTKILGFVFGSTENQSITLDGEWTIRSDGNTYNAVIENQLTKTLPCQYTGEGLLLLSKNGLTVSVDYGDGTCDNVASLLYPDNTSEQITLKD